MERRELLKSISFGARVAEEETAELSKYFVETDQWTRFLNGDVDVIQGDKGAGKSAIYSLLVTRTNWLRFSSILLTTAERPRGTTVFRDLITDPPTSEQEFVSLWKLYIITLIGQKVRELKLRGPNSLQLVRLLTDHGMLEADFDLGRAFKHVRTYVSRYFHGTVEGAVSIDPNTLIPTITGKITPGEPSSDQRKLGFVSMDDVATTANRALTEANYKIWVLLDRLDVAFAESHELEKNALRALFRVYRDFGNLDAVKLKIFLRSDIWNRIVEGGFREASHITRVAILDWTNRSLLNLIIKRLLNNSVLLATFKLDRVQILKSEEAQLKIFDRFFPLQVEQGSKKRSTFDWLVSRCSDATGKTAPREIIHLLTSARDEEIKRIELGGSPPEGDVLFDRSVFKPALAEVSKARLVQTIYAEHPDLKRYIESLDGEKTEQTVDSLAKIWNASTKETSDVAGKLVAIGFFEIHGSREAQTFWVPFLYRDALSMSQGLADN